MRKLNVLFFLLILNYTAFSQISIKLGPLVGLTSPTIDYSGDGKDFYAGTKYGMRSGLNYGVMGKVQFGPLNGRLSISYASLDNNGNANPNQPSSTVEIKNNLFMFTIGTEFGFGIPFSPVKPYAGIDILFSSISGTYNFQGTSEVSSGEKTLNQHHEQA